MNEMISVKPKILELQNTNDIYMSLFIRILSAEPNANLAEFTEDFILNTVKEKNSVIGIPFMVDKESLENKDYSNLTHKLTPDGELETDQIGSFVDFWVDKDEDGVLFLAGEVRIMKRFKETCAAVHKLYSSGKLNTSCEVMVESYQEITDDGVRKIGYNDGKNKLFASCLVTNPADKKATASLLVAEAYQKDINSEQKGEKELPKEKEYNNGIKVEYCGKLETASLKWHEIEQQIFNIINPIDAKTGYREYNYYIHTLYHDKVILESESSYNNLYSANYKIENDTVIVDKESDWKKGSFQFVPEGVEISELMEQNTGKIKELQKEIAELKEENNTMSKEQKKDIEVNENKIEVLEKEIAELKETIVSEQEAKLSLEGQVTALNEEIETLKPFKEQVEKAEKEAKVKELKAKYSKLIANEEVFNSERVTKAIDEGDVVELNNVVVEEIAKQKEQEVETAEQEEKDVVITASVQENLITVDKDADYWYDSRD